MKKLSVTAIIGVMLAGLVVTSASALTIHGSTTVKSTICDPYERRVEAESGVPLVVVGTGSSRGIRSLMLGTADMAMISAPLVDINQSLKFDKYEEGLQEHVLGEASVVFAVHPVNPVKSLTTEQLKGILLGDIKSWADVGGLDQPIVVVVEYKGGGIRATVEKDLLEGRDIVDSVRVLQNAAQIPDVAAQLPNSLAVLSDSFVGEGLNPLAVGVDLRQQLSFVTNGAPTLQMTRVIDLFRRILREAKERPDVSK